VLASDLHVHIDGSLRPSTLAELAAEHGLCPRELSQGRFVERLRFEPGMTLRSCLERFNTTVLLLQSSESLRRVTSELVVDGYRDGVRHMEARLCPSLHVRGGLRPEQVLDAALAGIEEGKVAVNSIAPGDSMSAGLIVTILEGMSEDEAHSLVELAMAYADLGVLGVDIAGDEALFDATRFEAPLARARDAGLGVTVHAGEGHEASHVRDAVQILRAHRIGHGIGAAGDEAAQALLVEHDVTLEVCISSNLHTGAIERVESHPLKQLAERGIGVVLATDNRFFSTTTLSREYDIAQARLGISPRMIEQFVLASATASFLREGERTRLRDLYLSSVGSDGQVGEPGDTE
jgi:adenosine deaminase